MNWNVKRFFMLNISQVILMRTDSNLCRKELTVHWSTPDSLIRSYLKPCANSMWRDESEAVAPIIWLYQIVEAQKEEVFFPELLITLRSYDIGTHWGPKNGRHFKTTFHNAFTLKKMYFQLKRIRDSDLSSFIIRQEFITSFNKQQSSVSPVGPVGPVSSIHHNGICPDVRPSVPWRLGTTEPIAAHSCTLKYTHGWYVGCLAVAAYPLLLNQYDLSIHIIHDYLWTTMWNVGMYIMWENRKAYNPLFLDLTLNNGKWVILPIWWWLSWLHPHRQ